MNVHVDDRRLFYGNIFPDAGLAGDLNIVVLQPGALIAWHRHQHQTDHLFCVKGSVKVGVLIKEGEPYFEVLHERYRKELVILRDTWHGYMNLSDGESILLSYNTAHYNPEDEERRMPDPNEWKTAPR